MPHNWIHKLNESNSKLHKLDVIAQALESANLGAEDAKEFIRRVKKHREEVLNS